MGIWYNYNEFENIFRNYREIWNRSNTQKEIAIAIFLSYNTIKIFPMYTLCAEGSLSSFERMVLSP